MKEMLVIFNNKEYKCIQKDKLLFLIFEKTQDIPRGNGWCLIKHDSLKLKYYICKSKDNKLLYNNNCVVYDIIFSCYLNSHCDKYIVEFYSDLFNKAFTRFSKSRAFQLKIDKSTYKVVLGKKNKSAFCDIGVMTFCCDKIKEEDLLNIYYFVSSFSRFISLDTSSYPYSFFVNGVEGFSKNNRRYDWNEIDYLHIEYMSSSELETLAQYVADNSHVLYNLYFSSEEHISTKDVGSLYSVIDKTLDVNKPYNYCKQVSKKRDAIRHNDVLLLIKEFGEKYNISKRKEFVDFYSNAKRFELSINEKIEFVLDDYLKVFKDDDEMLLSKKDDLLDFSKAIKGIRNFDAHGDDTDENIIKLGLYYSTFLQELAYYSIFKFSLSYSNKTIRNVFSNCFSFVSINSNIWIRSQLNHS